MRAFQIYAGLGAGNIGDEFMARAFWQRLPAEVSLDVSLAGESGGQHEPYPPQHRYLRADEDSGSHAAVTVPGLLVGATPVTASEGLAWPLRFLAPRLLEFHRANCPVDAVGVGVDHLDDACAQRIFQEAFAPIRSWTVRSPQCLEALRSLGTPESRIRLGADWAWLYHVRHDLRHWAAAVWRRCGVDPGRPLLVANVVNMLWRDHAHLRQTLAAALRKASEEFDLQLAFFCNESRPGQFFDSAGAREIGGLTGIPHALVPNQYYSPDEALALLAGATVTVGFRYHFMVESVLAGTVPVGILRGQKMSALAAELPFPVGRSVESMDPDELIAGIRRAIEERDPLLASLAMRRRELARRAGNNLSFLRELPPYRDCRQFRAGF